MMTTDGNWKYMKMAFFNLATADTVKVVSGPTGKNTKHLKEVRYDYQ